MAVRITELTFLQHLASRFNLPIPEYLTADATDGLYEKEAVEMLSMPD